MEQSPFFALQTHQLTVNYDTTPVLWDITLSIPAGHLVGIIGPNGAGKSTFIETILNLIKPLSGQILFFGKPLKEMRRQIAYIPQRKTVDWDFPLTVQELVLMGCYGNLSLLRSPRAADRAAVDHYLECLEMAPYANRQIGKLSGGQKQRAFLARALMQQADIYFMDEPFEGIDIASEALIMNLLRELKSQGKTLFIVHHDLESVRSYFDWLIMLNMRLIACGDVSTVFTAEMLQKTYGKSATLFDEALRLWHEKK